MVLVFLVEVYASRADGVIVLGGEGGFVGGLLTQRHYPTVSPHSTHTSSNPVHSLHSLHISSTSQFSAAPQHTDMVVR